MNSIRVPRRVRSGMVWSVLYDDPPDRDYAESLISLQRQRCGLSEAPSTLRPVDVQELHCIVRVLQPRTVVEIGTYIGVSTVTIAEAMGQGDIYTCDRESEFTIESTNDVVIHQYRRVRSMEMFADLASKGIQADLIYIDGRIVERDVEGLKPLLHEQTVFVLDDFEGIEKGVFNAVALMQLLEGGRDLITPREARSKTAIVMSFKTLTMVAQ